MNAIVVPFPKAFSPPPKSLMKLPKPRKGNGDSWVTTHGELAFIPFTWNRFLRLLIIIEPSLHDGRPVDQEMCHRALEQLAIDYTRNCYGEGADCLLRMYALLEKTPAGRFLYTIFFEPPDHAQLSYLEGAARAAFHEFTNSDEEMPAVVASAGAGSGEVLHLMFRSLEAEEG
jgi:hypothetical protein